MECRYFYFGYLKRFTGSNPVAPEYIRGCGENGIRGCPHKTASALNSDAVYLGCQGASMLGYFSP